MPKFRAKTGETFDAEQWFPGKKVEGVRGDDPHKICGCLMFGGPHDKPHVHTGLAGGVLVEPGDWVFRDWVSQAGGAFYRAMRPEEFVAAYEPADDGDIDVPVDCRSREGVTLGLVDAIFSNAQVLHSRSGWSHPAVRAALDDLRADPAARAVMGLPVPNPNPVEATPEPPR